MRLLQMTYFLTIADTGSITKAAEYLFISQPALSKQIAMLEEEIGTKLLKRKPRGVVLTEAGIQFAKDCRKIMSQIDEAVTRAAAIGNAQPRTIRIGCFDGAYIEDFMPGLYQHLKKHDPDLKIRLLRQTMGENRRAFRTGEIDLMIEPLAEPLDPTSFEEPIEMKVLVHRTGGLIYSENSSLAKKEHLCIEDFKNEPLLLIDTKNNQILTRHAREALQALGIPHPKVESFENIMSLLSTLKLGHGYTILTKAVADQTPGLRAFDLPDHFGLDILAVWRKKNTLVDEIMSREIQLGKF